MSLGPVAVMSLLVGEILGDIAKELPHIPPAQVASILALFAGIITLGIGLFRLGFIIDFISGPAIAGFMSGSALTIGISQLAGLFGIPGVDTRYFTLGANSWLNLYKIYLGQNHTMSLAIH